MANKLGIFLAGGVIGAAVALLYAPRPGVETRAMVADRANEAWGQAQNLGGRMAARGQEAYAGAVAYGHQAYGQAAEFGQTVYTNVAAKGQAAGARAAEIGKQAYENASAGAKQAYAGAKTGAAAAAQRVQSTAENVRPIFAEKNDELRAKIDAARERIAAQVTKNAEAAHAAVAEKAPIAAEGAAADVAEPEQISESASEDKKDAE